MKIIFLGSQGSGKSTQAKMLALALAVPYIEMGQLFRNKAKETSVEADEIKKALDVGDLVSDEITVKTLREKLAKSDCQNGFVLDGYPRNDAQLKGLTTEIDHVFFITIPDQEAIARLIKRGREDDTPEIIARRLENFHKLTEPLLAHFRNLNILQEIDGLKTIEEVNQEILEKLKINNDKN